MQMNGQGAELAYKRLFLGAKRRFHVNVWAPRKTFGTTLQLLKSNRMA